MIISIMENNELFLFKNVKNMKNINRTVNKKIGLILT